MSSAATFPTNDWTPCEPTKRIDYEASSVPRLLFQPDAELIAPLPPPPFDLVPMPAREWRIPWAFFASMAVTLAMVALACR